MLVAAALDDRYVVEREIGAGGMAIVYLARDRKLNREVALKVLRPELGAVLGAERFLAEIRISAQLNHPHILDLLDSGEAGGLLYCVLPYVRGESLRDKLDREHRLSIDAALKITRQIASALDYAHRQGLVHRDIKPENILLQEGEAMLADFGIALAVQSAGGQRLTQTGLSLGTPQYMSPEQATGDRGIDARSDVYSLAAVLYEMLAGEPPVTGGSVQSIIAKLMTETPTRLRVLRDSVTPAIDAAVARALSKTPADRFASAGEFVRTLEGSGPTQLSASRFRLGGRRLAIGALAAAALVAILGVGMRARNAAAVDRPAALGAKTQLTTNGAVLYPAISPDGKQLAFLTQECRPAGCSLSIVVQDVGGAATHTILTGAGAVYGLEWSPDRRNLIFTGTIASRTGAYLVSALGGEPKFLTGSVATFWAGGDSLLLGPAFRPDSIFYIGVSGLDGVVHDSIRVVGPGQNLGAISAVPGTRWILTLVVQRPLGLWQVIDRSGNVADRVVNACSCGGIATSDAVWLTREENDPTQEAVVRISIDRASGKLAARQDTMARGLFTAFSLTADGRTMVIDQGAYDHGVWAVPFDSARAGVFPEAKRLARASSQTTGVISPGGSRVLVRRTVPTAGGQSETRLGVLPFDGGAEVPVTSDGMVIRSNWSDSVHVTIASRSGGGALVLSETDVRTGARRNRLAIPDSAIRDFTALSNGWAWIPASSDRITVVENERRRVFPKPAWFGGIAHLVGDPAHGRVFYTGWGGPGADSVGLGVLSLETGAHALWTATPGDAGRIVLVDGHDALFLVQEGRETWSLYTADGPSRIAKLGTIPRPVSSLTASRDLKRIVANVRDYRADAWMSKVIP
jgi:tRNA A-37 threonylcarbamoyl transferase component Bud32